MPKFLNLDSKKISRELVCIKIGKHEWLSNNRFSILAGNELHIFEGDNAVQQVAFSDVSGVIADVCYSHEFNGFVAITDGLIFFCIEPLFPLFLPHFNPNCSSLFQTQSVLSLEMCTLKN